LNSILLLGAIHPKTQRLLNNKKLYAKVSSIPKSLYAGFM
jgi:hypothetical protein